MVNLIQSKNLHEILENMLHHLEIRKHFVNIQLTKCLIDQYVALVVY